jgi:hypothetical protein
MNEGTLARAWKVYVGEGFSTYMDFDEFLSDEWF